VVYSSSGINQKLACRPVTADGVYRGNPEVVIPYRKPRDGSGRRVRLRGLGLASDVALKRGELGVGGGGGTDAGRCDRGSGTGCPLTLHRGERLGGWFDAGTGQQAGDGGVSGGRLQA
jgi:hypothetical protein